MKPPLLWLEAGGVEPFDVPQIRAGIGGGNLHRPIPPNKDPNCSDRGDSQHSDSKLAPDKHLLVRVNNTLCGTNIHRPGACVSNTRNAVFVPVDGWTR